MSALEPDAPDAHVFPHIREALRAWWSHRQGKEPSRGRLGAVRGKGPAVGDVLRVGRLLADMDMLNGAELNNMGEQLVGWALGLRQRSDDRKVKSAIERVEWNARKIGLVSKARRRIKVRRDSWHDTEGEVHESTYCVDSS